MSLSVFIDDGASTVELIVRNPPTHDHSSPEHAGRPGGGRDDAALCPCTSHAVEWLVFSQLQQLAVSHCVG